MTSTLVALPVVFPRIEVNGDSASLLCTIRLEHISSEEGYTAWVRGLESTNTTVIKLHPLHFAQGILGVIRRKLAPFSRGRIRVKSTSVPLDEQSRAYTGG